jgi:hypothetical protein
MGMGAESVEEQPCSTGPLKTGRPKKRIEDNREIEPFAKAVDILKVPARITIAREDAKETIKNNKIRLLQRNVVDKQPNVGSEYGNRTASN